MTDYSGMTDLKMPLITKPIFGPEDFGLRIEYTHHTFTYDVRCDRCGSLVGKLAEQMLERATQRDLEYIYGKIQQQSGHFPCSAVVPPAMSFNVEPWPPMTMERRLEWRDWNKPRPYRGRP